mmetsp:Transcript_123450/g.343894  ORF Transcript_123450/g.343894 Transcript_123450/m.343894 type:complete len:384 (+) Transcript_123450:49-1200(+)
MDGVVPVKTVVKNTFLELVEAEDAQPKIFKCQTDPVVSDFRDVFENEGSLGNACDGVPGASGKDEAAAAEAAAAALAVLSAAAGPTDGTGTRASLAGSRMELKINVIVKNTFLEILEEDEEQPRCRKSKTAVEASVVRHGSDDEEPRNGCAQVLGAPASTIAERWADKAESNAAEEASLPMAAREPLGGIQGDADSLQEVGSEVHCSSRQGTAAAPGIVRGRERASSCQRRSMSPPPAETPRTTLMLRNVPNDYTRGMLLQLLDASGFAGRFDFVYIPMDFAKMAGLGYAFVNMVSAADAERAHMVLEGFRQWSVPSSKVCHVGWSDACQGLEANIQRFRNSPIMHSRVPDDCKPAVFALGLRVPFPRPTRKLRKPDLLRAGR